jgi:hypothetical protein
MALEDRGSRARARLRWAERNRALLSRLNSEWRKRDRERHPMRYRCRRTIENAVSRGAIASPARCDRCRVGSVRLEAHHPDYRSPLRVLWLCPDCHHAEHAKKSSGRIESKSKAKSLRFARVPLAPS